MTHRARPFRSDADLLEMMTLVGETAKLSGPIGHMHMGDVLWRRFMLDEPVVDPMRNVCLWENNERLLGFAWFSPPEGLETQLGSGVDPSLLAEMLDWGERRAVDVGRETGRPPTLVTDAYESDRSKLAILTERGYLQDDNAYFVLNAQSLDRALPAPTLPAGAVVRSVDEVSEIAARVAIHRTVWHPSRVTETAYRRLRTAPGYRPDLDLVVVAPDGKLAAYCICWHDPISRSGEFEPVGTDPTYRRQGYGRAVVLEGLRRLRELGATRAIVFSHGGESAANQLYAACGFEPIARTYDYRPTALTVGP